MRWPFLMHYVKFVLGAQVAFFGTINAFVHVIMYSYYFLTIFNPEYKKAWWKKYLTVIQLVMYPILPVFFLVKTHHYRHNNLYELYLGNSDI